jgi:16S rRNA (cytosine1402-N4)-methyltransferase
VEERAREALEVADPDGPVHRPIMLAEVLRCLGPVPGDTVVDCTLGGGSHAGALLDAIVPCGLLIGLDVDPLELPRTVARLRAAGYGPDVFRARRANFANLADVLAAEAVAAADAILVDLGTSAMQHETAARGFNYKHPGPLDLRMDPSQGETAAALLARLDVPAVEQLLIDYADEPHAATIARLLGQQAVVTTHALERVVRLGLGAARPDLPKADVRMSVRRTFQALRIAVNDELAALDRLLAALPACLAPGGRVAVLTFHSGEDRRVKQAFRQGHRDGTYADVARVVIRSSKAETFADRRAAAAKLRWARLRQ